MGTSNYYECKQCNKQITASLTETEGMVSKVLAVKCNDCGKVTDSVIERHFDWNDETVKEEPACEECGSEDVVKWDGKCPECDIMMVDEGMFMLWD